MVKIVLFSFLFITVAPVLSMVLAADASAQTVTTTATADANVLVTTMCNALNIITGSGGKAFAAFAIISVGIGFFTGKVSWGLLIGVAMGIAAMFGAPSIVSAINGKASYDCGR